MGRELRVRVKDSKFQQEKMVQGKKKMFKKGSKDEVRMRV
jgi:hypothetical protein